MSAIELPCPNWRDLYLAALYENNKSQLPARVAVAEQAIIRRTRELFTSPTALRERHSLESALVALHALRSCFENCGIRNRDAA
jgi:hypothetical protein